MSKLTEAQLAEIDDAIKAHNAGVIDQIAEKIGEIDEIIKDLRGDTPEQVQQKQRAPQIVLVGKRVIDQLRNPPG